MGQTLSEPVTQKETTSCSSDTLRVGSSSMQGWRINMEDAHTHLLSCPDDKDAAFFGVYDGHGGAKVAQYAGHHLHKRILQSHFYAENRYEEALKDGFLGLDQDMLGDEEMKEELAGTTAVVALVKDSTVYCANAGDSRCVTSVAGLAEPLSFDHKPANEGEARRIVAAGGWVEFNRVNGNLALSRALGDFIFKRNEDKPAEEQIVTALPEVITRPLTPAHEFIVLACDGIWDVLSNQEVVDFVRDRIASEKAPEVICEELLTRCLAPDCQMGGLGCDNMTVVLVCLLGIPGSPTPPTTYKDLAKKCARPRPPTPQEEADDPTQEEMEEQAPVAGTSPYATPPLTPNPDQDEEPTQCEESVPDTASSDAKEKFTVAIHPDVMMSKGGTTVPCLHAHLTSIGKIGREYNKEYAAQLCAFLEAELSISPSRMMIKFDDAEKFQVGNSGSTME